jgi:cellulose synthase/poly-beta-1,6-N-acetylglucosamine synthase-like glycosyltransferase
MRAKDRLDLAPALLGSNCAYRRTALLECGGFKEGSFLEDSDITLAFYRAGYRIRFAQDVEALHQVPETIRGYINQHSRWARGFMNVANQQGIGSLRDRELSLPLRVELFLFSAGYLDRIALIGAIAIGLLSLLMGKNFQLLWVVIALALLTPWIQVILLFAEQRMPLPMWLRLPFIPFFYVFDLVSAGLGVVDSLTRKVGTWKKTERSLQEDYGS